MKKIFFMLLFAVIMGVTVNATPSSVNMNSYTEDRDITFRSTQKLRASDGFEMYLYTNHTIEMYDDQGRTAGSGTWKLIGDELFIYNNGGGLIAKCPIKHNGLKVFWVKFNGSTYYSR